MYKFHNFVNKLTFLFLCAILASICFLRKIPNFTEPMGQPFFAAIQRPAGLGDLSSQQGRWRMSTQYGAGQNISQDGAMVLDRKQPCIYIVTSCCSALAGHVIRFRARMKFWNRYPGDCYSHVSLSLDSKLDRMFSFARKELHNPLVSGFTQEDIRTGVFAFHPDLDRIAVFRIPVGEEQYQHVCEAVSRCWNRRRELRYNFLGLFTMLLIGKGVRRRNHYFCSQWVAELLAENGLYSLGRKRPRDVRPFDLYIALASFKLFEGPLTDYPLY